MNKNKKILTVLAACSLSAQLFAGGNIAPVAEPMVEVPHAEVSHESDFYIIAKGLTVLGDDVAHGDAILDGDQGYGFGIDLGYRIGNGFAVEYDFSYATNTVTETEEGHQADEGDATYYSHAINLVYTLHLSHTLGLFGKVGYEYEIEEIKDFDIDSDADGFAYGVGLEYAVNDHYALVVEYEGSDIEGPRGDSVFAGVMYNF